MKKIVAILLAVLTLCTCFACAEESAFTFRNGLHWGMTPEEVLAAEGRTAFDAEGSLGPITKALLLADISVSKYTASGACLFVDGKLAGILIDPYMMVNNNEEDVEYLRQALSTVYGAAADLPVTATVQALLDAAGYVPLYAWQPTADSYICIVLGDPFYGICYLNTEVDFFNAAPAAPASEKINTNGL